MNRRVYKYPIPGAGFQFSQHLPEGAQFLRVAMQNDTQQMWFLIPDGAKPVERKFRLYGTGQDVQPGAKWLYTYDNGPFVLHLFEL